LGENGQYFFIKISDQSQTHSAKVELNIGGKWSIFAEHGRPITEPDLQ